MLRIIPGLLLIITIGCGENDSGNSSLAAAERRDENGRDKGAEGIGTLDIFIGEKQFKRITIKRSQALYRGQLMSFSNDWVPATMVYRGDTMKADIRLKGDLNDHWGHDEHWSFKVQMKGGSSFMGMKRFAIQRPVTRSFLNEWVLHELMKYNDLIALNYDFLNVTLNGKSFPVYAIEENFDKRLIERNELREGIIFRFDREFLWHHDPGMNDAFYSCLIKPYQENKTLRNEVLRDQYFVVRNLIEEFRAGVLKTHQVFDSEKLALSFALLDLTGHHHASALDNLKFYYNPITSLIEPIIYDNQGFLDLMGQGLLGEYKSLDERYKLAVADHTNSYWYQHLFMDRVFFEDYLMALERIGKREYLDNFIESLEGSLASKIKLLHTSYPKYTFGYEVLYTNQEYIQKLLQPEGVFQINIGEEMATLSSSHSLPLNILSLQIGNREYIEKPFTIQAIAVDEEFSQGIPIALPADVARSNPTSTAIIEYQIPGASAPMKTEFVLKDALVDNVGSNTAASELRQQEEMGIRKLDLPKLAKYLAVRDLLGPTDIPDAGKLWAGYEGIRDPNGKNETYSRVKVEERKFSIPSYEILGVRDYRQRDLGTEKSRSLLHRLFGNADFFRAYVSALEDISAIGFLENRPQTWNYREFAYFYRTLGASKRKTIAENQKYLRQYLNPIKALHIHFESIDLEAGKLFLRVSNAHKFPIEILDAIAYKEWIFTPFGNKVVPGTIENELMRFEIVEFSFQKRFAASWKKLGGLEVKFPWDLSMLKYLEVNYRIHGASRSKTETIHPFKRFDEEFLKRDFIRQATNDGSYDMLQISIENKTFTLNSGEWTLASDLKIPRGYTLVIKEGTTLNMTNGSMILSYSPVIAIGTEDNPIEIKSSDSTGQGLSVISAGGKSQLERISFRNLANPSKNGWVLSGAVNFYESNVDISNCSFESNKCEDALNIIRSAFTLSDSKFANIYSDAVDLDFSEGTIKNTLFEYIGNDAIDVSGGDENVLSNIQILNAGDKGISIGEGATILADQIKIVDTEIAVAVKDRSSAQFKFLDLKDCGLGFAAFEKKSEYGGSTTSVEKLELDDVIDLYLLEEGSILEIEGKNLAPNCESVTKQLYGIRYGKSSSPTAVSSIP